MDRTHDALRSPLETADADPLLDESITEPESATDDPMIDDTQNQLSPARSGDPADSAAKRCAYCSAVIDTTDWYPVTKGRTTDGSLTFYYFDSAECQEAWLDEHGERLPA